MGNKIKITAGSVSAEAELNDSASAKRIYDALPIEASANTWGDEIYFSIPVKMSPENPVEVVEMGDIAYWTPGSAFCIFFGLTPASRGDEIRPASAVTILGRIQGDPKVFKKVHDGDKIRIEKI
ncbi:MAG: cyclophilin-like fold protein [bacterium]